MQYHNGVLSAETEIQALAPYHNADAEEYEQSLSPSKCDLIWQLTNYIIISSTVINILFGSIANENVQISTKPDDLFNYILKVNQGTGVRFQRNGLSKRNYCIVQSIHASQYILLYILEMFKWELCSVSNGVNNCFLVKLFRL